MLTIKKIIFNDDSIYSGKKHDQICYSIILLMILYIVSNLRDYNVFTFDSEHHKSQVTLKKLLTFRHNVNKPFLMISSFQEYILGLIENVYLKNYRT